MVTLWIDITSGFYGNIEDLRIVTVDDETAEAMDNGLIGYVKIAAIGMGGEPIK